MPTPTKSQPIPRDGEMHTLTRYRVILKSLAHDSAWLAKEIAERGNSHPALLAFHGKPSIKREYLDRVRKHQKADEIISGRYWENGRGCAVGCTIHGSNHFAYEAELGIPAILALMEDRLFERLYGYGYIAAAKAWPNRFLSAITPGADLSLVWPKFMVWIMSDAIKSVIKVWGSDDSLAAAFNGVLALYQRWSDGAKPPSTEWESAREFCRKIYRATRATLAARAELAALDALAARDALADRADFYLKASEKLLELLKEAALTNDHAPLRNPVQKQRQAMKNSANPFYNPT